MKASKKSLLASGVSLLASAALLAGATFAWFTDSVTNTGNKIQAGTLAINAYAYDLAADGGDLTIEGVNGGEAFGFDMENGQNLKTDTAPIIDDTLFEPGKSNAKLLKVENAGTLATKIKLNFTVEDGGLMDALWFDFVQVKDGKVVGMFQKRPMSELETIADGMELPLLANENVQFILVYGMDESAGNAFMEKTFSADVAILAAQYTEEEDGFGSDQYDAQAQYPIVSQQALQAAIMNAQSGDTIFVGKLDLSDPIVLDKDITLKGVDGSVLNNAVIQGKNNAAVAIEDIDFTGDGYIHNQGMSALTLTGCDINVNVSKNVNNGRASFISLGTNQGNSIKLDIRDNHIVAKSTVDAYVAAIFGWSKLADGSVISGNTFGSADSRYTFIAVKLMNFDNEAVVDISGNTVYGTNKVFGFYAFDMYQCNSRDNAYTAVFADNTMSIEVAGDNDAYFIDLESEGNGNATIHVADGNTFNGEPVAQEHVLIETQKGNPGTVEFIGVDEGNGEDPF